MTPIILIGGGGHCRSCIDVIEATKKYQIIGVIDGKLSKSDEVLGYPVLGSDSDIPNLIKTCRNFLITVGQIKSFSVRKKLYEQVVQLGGEFPVIISPLSYVSKHSSIGNGTIVMHGSIVNSGCKIGENTILNTKSLCEHDVVIGSHCHISTGAIVNGQSEIGDGVFVGSNSVIKNGIKIEAETIIPYGIKHG